MGEEEGTLVVFGPLKSSNRGLSMTTIVFPAISDDCYSVFGDLWQMLLCFWPMGLGCPVARVKVSNLCS